MTDSVFNGRKYLEKKAKWDEKYEAFKSRKSTMSQQEIADEWDSLQAELNNIEKLNPTKRKPNSFGNWK